MNIKKFSKRLNKINLLFQSIKEDGHVSSIEKDLLLNYLRDAYEYVKEDEHENDMGASAVKKVYKEPEVHVPPKVLAQSEPEPVKAEVMSQIIQEEVAEVSSEEQETPANQTSESNAEEGLSEDLKKIFENDSVSELSDRLSMSPIADMTKAMGINERIFTVKELFGGDNDIFNSILQKLNSFRNYDEARQYLITGIAKDQDWENPAKIKKADAFIKLVKRRYV